MQPCSRMKLHFHYSVWLKKQYCDHLYNKQLAQKYSVSFFVQTSGSLLKVNSSPDRVHDIWRSVNTYYNFAIHLFINTFTKAPVSDKSCNSTYVELLQSNVTPNSALLFVSLYCVRAVPRDALTSVSHTSCEAPPVLNLLCLTVLSRRQSSVLPVCCFLPFSPSCSAVAFKQCLVCTEVGVQSVP